VDLHITPDGHTIEVTLTNWTPDEVLLPSGTSVACFRPVRRSVRDQMAMMQQDWFNQLLGEVGPPGYSPLSERRCHRVIDDVEADPDRLARRSNPSYSAIRLHQLSLSTGRVPLVAEESRTLRPGETLRFAVAIPDRLASHAVVWVGPTNGTSDSQHALELLAACESPLLQILDGAAPVRPPAGESAREQSWLLLPEGRSYAILKVRNLYADTVQIRRDEVLGFAFADGPYHRDSHLARRLAELRFMAPEEAAREIGRESGESIETVRGRLFVSYWSLDSTRAARTQLRTQLGGRETGCGPLDDERFDQRLPGHLEFVETHVIRPHLPELSKGLRSIYAQKPRRLGDNCNLRSLLRAWVHTNRHAKAKSR
jgi:hypothetical protein